MVLVWSHVAHCGFRARVAKRAQRGSGLSEAEAAWHGSCISEGLEMMEKSGDVGRVYMVGYEATGSEDSTIAAASVGGEDEGEPASDVDGEERGHGYSRQAQLLAAHGGDLSWPWRSGPMVRAWRAMAMKWQGGLGGSASCWRR